MSEAVTEIKAPIKQGDRVRLTPRGLTHIVWGTHTVCGRKIPDGASVSAGALCRQCRSQPVVTLTYTSGRQERYCAR